MFNDVLQIKLMGLLELIQIFGDSHPLGCAALKCILGHDRVQHYSQSDFQGETVQIKKKRNNN